MTIGVKTGIDQILLLGNSRLRLYSLLAPEPLSLPASRESLESLGSSLSKPLLVSVRPDLEVYLPSHQSLDPDMASVLFGVQELYPGFGLDRLAGLLGALALSSGSSEIAVLDFGTFFTYSALSLEGQIWRLTGNTILPGLASVQSLYAQAGDPSMAGLTLSSSEISKPNSTLGAIQRGLRAYINGFLTDCLPAGFACDLFVTGGAAADFRDHPMLLGAKLSENLLALGARAYLDRLETLA